MIKYFKEILLKLLTIILTSPLLQHIMEKSREVRKPFLKRDTSP